MEFPDPREGLQRHSRGEARADEYSGKPDPPFFRRGTPKKKAPSFDRALII